MPEEEAQVIIRCCAQQYIAARFARERQIAQWRAIEHMVVRSAGTIEPGLKALIDEKVAALDAESDTPERA